MLKMWGNIAMKHEGDDFESRAITELSRHLIAEHVGK
jgi:hypothetical protein